MGYNKFLLGFTGFYWVLSDFTRINWVLMGLFWVLLGFTGFYWVLSDFTRINWVLMSLFWVLLGFI